MVDKLPTESLLSIFAHLSATDLCNTSFVCAFWRTVATTNSLWKALCVCAHTAPTLHAQTLRLACGWKYWAPISEDWKATFTQRTAQDRHVVNLINAMCEDQLARKQAKGEVIRIGVEAVDALSTLLTTLNQCADSFLDLKYYASNVLAKIKENICLDRWRELLAKPPNAQVVEDGAILLCRWEYPGQDLKIYEQLDSLAGRLRDKITSDDPLHVLQTLSYMLFEELEIRGNEVNYYEPQNSFITDVLARKLGIPISLSIIYAAVARRIGINILMVGMPSHFLVKYASPTGEDTFVDCFNCGRFLSAEQCKQILQANLPISFQAYYLDGVSNKEVWARMLRNLMEIYKRSGDLEKLEAVVNQLLLIAPAPPELFLRANIRRLHQDYEAALEDLQTVLQLNPLDPPQQVVKMLLQDVQELIAQEALNAACPKIKTPEVLFDIGKVFMHKTRRYHGVICGWDTECCAPAEWQEQVGVNLLQCGSNQLFYYVLIDTRDKVPQVKYVPQENIVDPVNNDGKIQHPSIGKYFERYDPIKRQFIPNKEFKRIYPDSK